MEPTDQMVEAALDVWFCEEDWKSDEYTPEIRADWRKDMRNALRAALAVMPDRYRAGWIAGRDAAAEEASDWGYNIPAGAIRRMEPPT